MKKLENMTMTEMRSLSARVQQAMNAARAKEIEKLRIEAEKLAAKSGMTIADVFGDQPRKRRSNRIYNPADKTQSYGGYGPKPKWLKAMERAA